MRIARGRDSGAAGPSTRREAVLDLATALVVLASITLIGIRVLESRGDTPGSSRLLAPPEWENALAAGVSVGAVDPVVTIVEFTDYECPACRRVQPRIDQLLATYPEALRVQYRQWPLEQHRVARRAAAAAVCAATQGRFEPVHRQLISTTRWMDDPIAGIAEIVAQSQVPDATAFDACMNADSTSATIDRDIAAGRALGGLGTPTFAINSVLYQELPDSTAMATIFSRASRK